MTITTVLLYTKRFRSSGSSAQTCVCVCACVRVFVRACMCALVLPQCNVVVVLLSSIFLKCSAMLCFNLTYVCTVNIHTFTDFNDFMRHSSITTVPCPVSCDRRHDNH